MLFTLLRTYTAKQDITLHTHLLRLDVQCIGVQCEHVVCIDMTVAATAISRGDTPAAPHKTAYQAYPQLTSSAALLFV
jgi:hypothetical protein